MSPEPSGFLVSGAMPEIGRYFIYDYYSVPSKQSNSSNPSRPRHLINICRYTIIIIRYEVLTQRLLEREKGKELPSLSH